MKTERVERITRRSPGIPAKQAFLPKRAIVAKGIPYVFFVLVGCLLLPEIKRLPDLLYPPAVDLPRKSKIDNSDGREGPGENPTPKDPLGEGTPSPPDGDTPTIPEPPVDSGDPESLPKQQIEPANQKFSLWLSLLITTIIAVFWWAPKELARRRREEEIPESDPVELSESLEFWKSHQIAGISLRAWKRLENRVRVIYLLDAELAKHFTRLNEVLAGDFSAAQGEERGERQDGLRVGALVTMAVVHYLAGGDWTQFEQMLELKEGTKAPGLEERLGLALHQCKMAHPEWMPRAHERNRFRELMGEVGGI